jgi:TldD protein
MELPEVKNMTGKFSKYLRSKKPVLRQLLNQLEENYAYASILATDVSGTNVSVDRSTTSVTPSGLTECGFVVKVFDGVAYAEYSTNDIGTNNLEAITTAIGRLVAEKGTIPSVDVGILHEEELAKRFTRKNRGRTYGTEEIIGILGGYVKEAMASSSEIVNARCSIETTEISKLFLSRARDLEQYYTWSNPRAFIIARRGENTKYAYDGFGDNSVEHGLARLGEAAKETAGLAVELLDSLPPKPGYYEIVTDPSITGLIAHEAFGHGVEMDMFVKDRAAAKEYMGKQVASPLVSMHDGAAATFSVASYFFDDDGVPAHDTKIIDRGILRSGISDALSALQLGTEPTGNGRRESYKRKAYTRMTNTFFEKGTSKLEDMIASVKEGYFIAKTNNGMEDPKNWGIQCTAHYGREIRDGKFTGKIVSPVVMSGYVIDLLQSITAVSRDFNVIGSGSCGKGYKEWVRVSDGGPCLKAKVKIG